MSNIIKNSKDYDMLKYYFDDIKNNGLSIKNIVSLIEEIIPRENGEILINSNINERDNRTPVFIPKYETIIISLNKFNEWLDVNLNDLSGSYKVNDLKSLRTYLTLFTLLHEIEHSYQYLLYNNKVEGFEVMKQFYKIIFEIVNSKEYVFPRPIKEIRRIIALIFYKLNQDIYFVERNANIEALEPLVKLSIINKDEECNNILNDLYNGYKLLGYSNEYCPIKETFSKIYMIDKYNKIMKKNSCDNISFEDKVNYGLPIDKEEINVLKKNFKNSYKK